MTKKRPKHKTTSDDQQNRRDWSWENVAKPICGLRTQS
jgi:hypothetical protein